MYDNHKSAPCYVYMATSRRGGRCFFRMVMIKDVSGRRKGVALCDHHLGLVTIVRINALYSKQENDSLHRANCALPFPQTKLF